MNHDDTGEVQRRTLLQMAAGLAATAGPASVGAAHAKAATPAATGKAGDFDFLSGQWKIKNRRLNDGAWDVFDGEASVVGILRGIASVEELRVPARNFSGMGLRLLDIKTQLWADYWVNGTSGALTPPPTWGSFVGGVGTWDSIDSADEKAVIYRGVWDQITPTSCRWVQATSKDGEIWQDQWVMNWTRA